MDRASVEMTVLFVLLALSSILLLSSETVERALLSSVMEATELRLERRLSLNIRLLLKLFTFLGGEKGAKERRNYLETIVQHLVI